MRLQHQALLSAGALAAAESTTVVSLFWDVQVSGSSMVATGYVAAADATTYVLDCERGNCAYTNTRSEYARITAGPGWQEYNRFTHDDDGGATADEARKHRVRAKLVEGDVPPGPARVTRTMKFRNVSWTAAHAHHLGRGAARGNRSGDGDDGDNYGLSNRYCDSDRYGNGHGNSLGGKHV
ncbi:hypothetical protein G7054_g15149 [Neopestalotiopsis clavispora]|nr:hypothetical protein G7054_g15149 [Neopestalotiopsis clavispora]